MSPDIRRQQVTTYAAFFIPGFAAAIWATLVPYAKRAADLCDQTLGLIILCLGIGSLIAMPLAGSMAVRFGCRRVMTVTAGLICLIVPLLGLAATPWALGPLLFAFGGAIGAMDCVMNMQAVTVEKDAGKAMMSGFHAYFSIGGFAGAACMTALLAMGIDHVFSAIACALLLLPLLWWARRHWREDRAAAHAPSFAVPRGIVLFIGVLAFIAFLAEGAVLDWSAVFLTETRHVSSVYAGAGFVMFSLSMTLTRLVGDRLVQSLGRHKAIVLGATVAALGFVIAALVQPWQLSLVGYLLLGLGAANIVPALFSLTGAQRRMPQNLAIPAVTMVGYAGVLAGPAVVGFVAHHLTLVTALLGIAFLLALVALSARWLPQA